MKQLASNVAFIDFYKEKNSHPGTPCGVLFTFLIIILGALTLSYILADSYWNPEWSNPFIGKKTKTLVQNIDLNTATSDILPKINYKCNGNSCLIYKIGSSGGECYTDEMCNGVVFQSTYTVTLQPGYHYSIVTRSNVAADAKTISYGSLEFQSGSFTSIPGVNSSLSRVMKLELTEDAQVSEYGVKHGKKYFGKFSLFPYFTSQDTTASIYQTAVDKRASVASEFSCISGSCFSIRLEVLQFMQSIQHHSNHVHFLNWISKFGSLISLEYIILYVIILIILAIVNGIVKITKNEKLKRYILLSPEDPEKPSFFHRILNLELFRDTPSQSGTFCGVCLTILFPIILVLLAVLVVFFNYERRIYNLINDQGFVPEYVSDFETIATEGNIKYDMFYRCKTVGGCYVATILKTDLDNGNFGDVKVAAFLNESDQIKVTLDSNHYYYIFLQSPNRVAQYESLYEFGMFNPTQFPENQDDPNDPNKFEVLLFRSDNKRTTAGNTVSRSLIATKKEIKVDESGNEISTAKYTLSSQSDEFFVDSRLSHQRFADLIKTNLSFCSLSSCFTLRYELESTTIVLKEYPTEKRWLTLLTIYGGLFSLTKSIFQTMIIFYVGLRFYLNSIYRMIFPKEETVEDENSIEMKEINVEENVSTMQQNKESSSITTKTTNVHVTKSTSVPEMSSIKVEESEETI
eukprot:gene3999-7255_t